MPVRTFDSGASRDADTGKYDFAGYLAPEVLWDFARYMEAHGRLPDGSVRASDNWKQGIPPEELFRSFLRHVMDLWMLHEGRAAERPENGEPLDWHEAFGGALFNLMGLWRHYLEEGLDG